MLLTERRLGRVEQDTPAYNDRLAKHNRALSRARQSFGLNLMSGPGSGETARVVLLSVTEGDNKPLKYANMFATAKLMLVTKADLLPFVTFDVERCSAFARRVNPAIAITTVSAITGAGLNSWYDWVARRRGDLRAPESIATGAFS